MLLWKQVGGGDKLIFSILWAMQVAIINNLTSLSDWILQVKFKDHFLNSISKCKENQRYLSVEMVVIYIYIY